VTIEEVHSFTVQLDPYFGVNLSPEVCRCACDHLLSSEHEKNERLVAHQFSDVNPGRHSSLAWSLHHTHIFRPDSQHQAGLRFLQALHLLVDELEYKSVRRKAAIGFVQMTLDEVHGGRPYKLRYELVSGPIVDIHRRVELL